MNISENSNNQLTIGPDLIAIETSIKSTTFNTSLSRRSRDLNKKR